MSVMKTAPGLFMDNMDLFSQSKELRPWLHEAKIIITPQQISSSLSIPNSASKYHIFKFIKSPFIITIHPLMPGECLYKDTMLHDVFYHPV